MELDMITTAKERVKSRRPSQKLMLVKISVFFVAAILILVHPKEAFSQESLTPVERTVPEFKLTGMDKQQWDSDSLLGKFWVVNFWATWCPPCIEEIPSMNKAWEILEPEGIGMLAINAGEGGAAVEEFLTKIPIDFPILLGNMDSLPNWSARALPTTLVVDASGKVIFEALGPREWDDEELLQRIIDLL
jgi:thiol-disulfide isomerase/thioredoxin